MPKLTADLQPAVNRVAHELSRQFYVAEKDRLMHWVRQQVTAGVDPIVIKRQLATMHREAVIAQLGQGIQR